MVLEVKEKKGHEEDKFAQTVLEEDLDKYK